MSVGSDDRFRRGLMERDKRSNTSEGFPSFDILIRGSLLSSGYEELIKVFGSDVAQSLSSSARRLLSEMLTTVSPSKRRSL